jgi:hypothetical protein
MKTKSRRSVLTLATQSLALVAGCGGSVDRAAEAPADTAGAAATEIADGLRIFRFETFGNETFWSDTLRLHEIVETAVDPTTALSVGLKVDADALPAGILETVDLKSPATTVALLTLNAVVGIQATVDSANRIVKLGITCALCHSTVDNSAAPGIGRRMDGWPNRDLDVGAIVALSGALTAAQKAVYSSWGPGKYDPRYNIDGKNTPLVRKLPSFCWLLPTTSHFLRCRMKATAQRALNSTI